MIACKINESLSLSCNENNALHHTCLVIRQGAALQNR